MLGSGLPVGMHELRLIERARMKRKWEQALPPVTGPESLNKRRMIVEAVERDEWAFREQVIFAIFMIGCQVVGTFCLIFIYSSDITLTLACLIYTVEYSSDTLNMDYSK